MSLLSDEKRKQLIKIIKGNCVADENKLNKIEKFCELKI